MLDEVDVLSIITAISAGGARYNGPSIAEWTELSVRVAEFLKVVFPPARTEAYEAWRNHALGLGRAAIPLLLLWIRDSDTGEEDVSLYALREMCGYAWAFGFEPDMYYRIVVDDNVVTVRPSTREILVEPATQEELTEYLPHHLNDAEH